MRRLDSRTTRPACRSGFTLVELMAVVLIIAALIALILPAIAGANRNARNAQVKAEITRLETAISSFQTRFNTIPPSRLRLTEDPSSFPWETRSQGLIRGIWGDFDFNRQNDLNHDGDINDEFALTGAECLAFFLFGIVERDVTGGVTLRGFSKDPTNPFKRVGENRDGPFIEFDVGRFRDVDDDGMLEYVDPLPGQETPYLYLSSYDGRGYQFPAALNSHDTLIDAPPAAVGNNLPADTEFDDMEVLGDPTLNTRANDINLNWPYTQGSLDWRKPFWKDKSFQIISPGVDGAYGRGGVFNPQNDQFLSPQDRDNITNFNSGSTLGG